MPWLALGTTCVDAPSQGSAAYLEAALRKIDHENEGIGYVFLLLQRTVALAWHLTMPSKGESTQSVHFALW